MARNNVKGVNNERTWKFYTILSSIIGVLIIAVVVGFIITYNVIYSDDYENIFSEYTEYKVNANEIDTLFDSDHVDERGKYTIIFAYNESYMTQSKIDDLDSDDTNRDSYIKANSAILELMNVIIGDGSNSNDNPKSNHDLFIYNASANLSEYYQYRVDIYFINTSLLGNTDFLSSKYTGSSSDDSKTAPAVFVLDSEGKYIDKVEYDDEEAIIKSDGTYVGLTSDLKELKSLVENFNKKSSNYKSDNTKSNEEGA